MIRRGVSELAAPLAPSRGLVPCFERVRVQVHAHPGARLDRVELVGDDQLGVWVRARAVDGQANAAIERAIAQALSLRARQVRLLAGLTSRRKMVEIELADLDVVRERLVARALRSS
jgi:uncharacterized protein YggU (UPF0235/DUF167 family)